MSTSHPHTPAGDELTPRERQVLEAVIRTYVAFAEPAGSRTVARRFELGVSPATVRNTMSDLEEKGYLYHPHTSAGRVPTDLAYRFFVDTLIRPRTITEAERLQLSQELDPGANEVERLIRRATRALSVLAAEMGVAVAPRLDMAVLERLELVRVASSRVLLVLTLSSGGVRTVYVDLEGDAPEDVLRKVTMVLNERLAGLSLQEIRDTLPARLRDAADDGRTSEVLNIFMQSGAELFDVPIAPDGGIHLGHASVLAAKPEFNSEEQLKELIELTERTEVLQSALQGRDHRSGLKITIGSENEGDALNDFTLITAEYAMGDLTGIIGVIGPTRMPYEKVISIVDYTSTLVSKLITR